ncbi:hypothetical protein C8R47DRAFT_1161280 [Mycena vitilis]|nr:hypothetical protein C8R47DRAFT_1161280 [Mycena vitilis]
MLLSLTLTNTTTTTTTTTMPNSTITLVLCFLAFVCGQVFQAAIHPCPVKFERVATVVAVAPGFSLSGLVLVVLAVLIVHDAVLVLLLHWLAKADVETKSARLASNILKAAVYNAPGLRRPTLLLLPPVPVNDPGPPPHSILVGPPRTIWVLPFLKMHRVGVLLIPRPFWTRAIYRQAVCALGPRAALPIQHPPVLALAPKHSTGSITSPPQDGVPLFRRLLAHLASGDAPVSGQEFDQDDGMQSIDASSTVEEKVGEEPQYRDKDVPEPGAPQYEEPLLDDITAPARPSRAPFLRYVAASALLRRLQFRAVDEACYASIEEVKEDDTTKVEEDFEEDIEGEYVGEDVEIVEQDAVGEDAQENVEDCEENVKEIDGIVQEVVEAAEEAVEESDKKTDEVEEEAAKEDVAKNIEETVEVEVAKTVEADQKTVESAEEDAEVEEAAQIADAAQPVDENIKIAGKVPVQAVPEVEGETHSVDALKTCSLEEKDAEDTAAEERAAPDYDYDDLPSYEDFVRDVPTDPLFEGWASAAPAYAITRPPPLAALAACTTATTRDARTRGSHLGLLSRIRLSSRVSAAATASA